MSLSLALALRHSSDIVFYGLESPLFSQNTAGLARVPAPRRTTGALVYAIVPRTQTPFTR